MRKPCRALPDPPHRTTNQKVAGSSPAERAPKPAANGGFFFVRESRAA